MAIRFDEDQVRAMGRSARGVTGVRFEADDKVVSMAVIPKHPEALAVDGTTENVQEHETTLLTVCQNGYGKRTLISEYRSQNRGGKGLIDIQTEGRNGPVIEALTVTAASGLLLITSSGKMIRTAATSISIIGRNTRGVKLIDLDENEKVVAVAPAPLDAPATAGEGVIAHDGDAADESSGVVNTNETAAPSEPDDGEKQE